jgi:cation diffusion facilitator family transporter
MLLALGAALLTLALKWIAYGLTGSVGLLSDAAESLINLVTALVAMVSLWYAALPVDESHTYGHEKIEYFSSGLVGVLILVAAGGIAWFAVLRLLSPQPLEALDLGVALAVVAGLINWPTARLLLRGGQQHHSIVLEAEGRHLMTDVLTSAGVVLGVGLVWLTSRTWLDPLIGLFVSANIVWTGYHLVRRSFDGLMDHALPEAEQAAVRAAIATHLTPGMDYHAIRTRQAGTRRFVDFHLLVPGALSVREAHELTAGIEAAIRTALPGIEITVHIEPIEDQASWQDSELVPLEQAARRAQAEAQHQGPG